MTDTMATTASDTSADLEAAQPTTTRHYEDVFIRLLVDPLNIFVKIVSWLLESMILTAIFSSGGPRIYIAFYGAFPYAVFQEAVWLKSVEMALESVPALTTEWLALNGRRVTIGMMLMSASVLAFEVVLGGSGLLWDLAAS